MIFVVLVAVVITTLAVFTISRILALLFASPRLASVDDVLKDRVAIVFGAGLRRDGTPSPILRDRVATAAQLYFAGKVEKLLMSGDNRFEDYNEPGAMYGYAVDLGVPPEDIVLDYAGRRTYDTCYRARDIFKLNSAILVTQSFHLPRALYVCNQLGLPAAGVSADQREYRSTSQLYWNLRETVATLVAFWEVHVSRPEPVLGDPEPIFPAGAQ
jgi:SanA protein